jgi:hypothetical protein
LQLVFWRRNKTSILIINDVAHHQNLMVFLLTISLTIISIFPLEDYQAKYDRSLTKSLPYNVFLPFDRWRLTGKSLLLDLQWKTIRF